MKIASLLLGLALLAELVTTVNLIGQVEHGQRCASILHTATDPHTPPQMRGAIFDELAQENCP